MRAHKHSHAHSHAEPWTLTSAISLRGASPYPSASRRVVTHHDPRISLSEGYFTHTCPPCNHTGQVEFSCRLSAHEHIPSEPLRELHTTRGWGDTCSGLLLLQGVPVTPA